MQLKTANATTIQHLILNFANGCRISIDNKRKFCEFHCFNSVRKSALYASEKKQDMFFFLLKMNFLRRLAKGIEFPRESLIIMSLKIFHIPFHFQRFHPKRNKK
ncbi:hypothetical protein ACKWTF_013265 [Chironomus riparius]